MRAPLVRLLGFAALLVAGGCRREPSPEAKPQPSAPRAASASAPASSAPLAVPPASPEDEAARKVVRDWNDALDRHDLGKLEALYAGTVRFYGSDRSKAAVVKAKRAAFAKQPGFRQELIGEISLSRASDGAVSASFTKKAGSGSDSLVVSAKLVLMPSAGGYLVAEEADEASSSRDPATPGDCEGKASEVANALPEVKRVVAEAMKEADESDGGATFGGMGPNDDGEGAFSASMGLHADGSYAPRFVYSVDKKGHLTVQAGGADVEVPREALKAVASACPH